MKKIALISAIALGSMFYNNVNAQVLQIGVRLGGGRPPVVQASVAAPVAVVGYAAADQYYYMPEVDAYYSVYEKCYYYNTGSRWVSAAYLPGAYRDYNWRNVRYYEVRAPRPYLNANVYRERYNGRVNYNWDRRDNRFDNRNDRRDDRWDNRNDRRDDRFDNRNDRRDDRFDNRNDRRDDRWDNRNDRKDDRWDNRNDRKDDRRDNNNLRFERRNDNDNRPQPGRGGNDQRGNFGGNRFAANK